MQLSTNMLHLHDEHNKDVKLNFIILKIIFVTAHFSYNFASFLFLHKTWQLLISFFPQLFFYLISLKRDISVT